MTKIVLCQVFVEEYNDQESATNIVICPKKYFEEHGYIPNKVDDMNEEEVYEINEIILSSNLCKEIIPSYYELKPETTLDDIEAYIQEHGWEIQKTNFKELRQTTYAPHIENDAHFSTRGGGWF